MKFRVIDGKHLDAPTKEKEDGIYRKGDIIETDVDLSAKFKNKFERVFPSKEPGYEKKKKDDSDDRPLPESKGEDVSHLFPNAEKNSLTVFKAGDEEYNVYEEDGKKPANRKPLKSEKKVEKFLDSY